MEAIGAALAKVLDAGGPTTALVVSLVVGLGLLAIVIARGSGLFAAGRTEIQAVSLQDRMLSTIKLMGETETALRARLDELETDNVDLRDQVIELRAQLSLLRGQRRKLIEIMREIKPGPAAMQAAAIEIGA